MLLGSVTLLFGVLGLGIGAVSLLYTRPAQGNTDKDGI